MLHSHYYSLLLLAGLLLMTACAPSLLPLYGDYKVNSAEGPLNDTIRESLLEAGWQIADSDVASLFPTEERTFSRWGIYSVVVSLDVTPIGDDYVRVLVHPYRKFLTGGRSKIPYLSRRQRHKILIDLTESFESRGLQLRGSPIERDRVARRR